MPYVDLLDGSYTRRLVVPSGRYRGVANTEMTGAWHGPPCHGETLLRMEWTTIVDFLYILHLVGWLDMAFTLSYMHVFIANDKDCHVLAAMRSSLHKG